MLFNSSNRICVNKYVQENAPSSCWSLGGQVRRTRPLARRSRHLLDPQPTPEMPEGEQAYCSTPLGSSVVLEGGQAYCSTPLGTSWDEPAGTRPASIPLGADRPVGNHPARSTAPQPVGGRIGRWQCHRPIDSSPNSLPICGGFPTRVTAMQSNTRQTNYV